MILVNISAVGTSTTLTLQPVACSHLGPEKFFGSSDCRPASQTIVIVLPPWHSGLAASTATCAALLPAVAAAGVAGAAAGAAGSSFLLHAASASAPATSVVQSKPAAGTGRSRGES